MAFVVGGFGTGGGRKSRCVVTCAATRREMLQWLALTPVLMLPRSSKAVVVEDMNIGFQFSVPDTFKESNTVLSGGRKLYLYVKDDVNVSAIATPIPGDYQKLTSFGTVDNVSKTLLPEGVNGKMNNIDTKPSRYIFDYSITPPNQPEKRLLTLFTIRPGQYIVTVTAQCNAENFANEEPQLRQIITSFAMRELKGYD